MKRIISFSLYGDKPIYTVGAIRNAESIHNFYPGWTARFYLGVSVPADVRVTLHQAGAELIEMSGVENASAMFWRYLAASDRNAELVMFRDCDSRFSEREMFAVHEWIASGYNFHIMRDHPLHTTCIMGGLWGAKRVCLEYLPPLIEKKVFQGIYGEDQKFLSRYVYPVAVQSAMIHDSFFFREWKRHPFPSQREKNAFVGEVFTECDEPNLKHRALIEAVTSLSSRLYILMRDFYHYRKNNFWGYK